jgi:hypothetical protein
MGNADKYRANAVHCFRMANKASDPDDEQTWLNMAETWLGMIPWLPKAIAQGCRDSSGSFAIFAAVLLAWPTVGLWSLIFVKDQSRGFTIFTAILRASSLLCSLAAERRPPSTGA